MDLSTLPVPVFTALDAVTQATAGFCYLLVGVVAWLRAPRDIRTRVFLALALSNLVVFLVPAIFWMRDMAEPGKLPRAATAVVMSGLSINALVLFHFTQVFPRRRPWVRTSGIQLPVAYILAPLATAGLIWFLPESLDALSLPYVAAMLIFGVPLLVLLGLVLPFAAILSLVRSYLDIMREGLVRLKNPLTWLLISQIAGGTLAVVFAPVLAVLAPNTIAQSILTVIIGGLGLLTPLAFAAAIWKFDLLTLDPG